MDLDVGHLKAPNPAAVVEAVKLQNMRGATLREIYAGTRFPIKVADIEDVERFNSYPGGWGRANQGIDLNDDGEPVWRERSERLHSTFDEAVAQSLACEQAAKRYGRGHFSKLWAMDLTGVRTVASLPDTGGMHNDYRYLEHTQRQYVAATQSGIIAVPHSKMADIFEAAGLGHILDIPLDEISLEMKKGLDYLMRWQSYDPEYDLLDVPKKLALVNALNDAAEQQGANALHLISVLTYHKRDPYCSRERTTFRAYAMDGPEQK